MLRNFCSFVHPVSMKAMIAMIKMQNYVRVTVYCCIKYAALLCTNKTTYIGEKYFDKCCWHILICCNTL